MTLSQTMGSTAATTSAAPITPLALGSVMIQNKSEKHGHDKNDNRENNGKYRDCHNHD